MVVSYFPDMARVCSLLLGTDSFHLSTHIPARFDFLINLLNNYERNLKNENENNINRH